jgi:hypothetical protein
MFAAIQVPIADARIFFSDDAGRLRRPGWPFAVTNKEFVRSFGVVRARPTGPFADWTESAYCEADRILRFPSGFGRVSVGRDGRYTVLRCVYRRLFSDGDAVVRLECGLTTRAGSGVNETFDSDGLTHLVGACLAVPVSVKQPGRTYTGDLATAGVSLAATYRRATGRVGANSDQSWMVTAAAPAIVVQHIGDPVGPALQHYRRVDELSDDDVVCLHARTQCSKQDVQTFVLRHVVDVDRDKLRRLRHFLFRRHAQREAIKAVLALVRQQRLCYEMGVPESERLSRWIDATLKALTQRSAFGFVVGSEVRLALGLDDVISPGEADLLANQLQEVRASVRGRLRAVVSTGAPQPTLVIKAAGSFLLGNTIGEMNMEDHTTQVGNISGSTIGGIGSKFSVSDSLNTITNGTGSDELKTLLKELAEQVATMTANASPEHAQAAARNAADLISEATAGDPRPSVLKALGEGLKSAAEAVGKVGLPVVAVVAKILALF